MAEGGTRWARDEKPRLRRAPATADFCGHAAVSAGFTEHKFIADSGLVATRALAFNLPRRLCSTNQVVENICQMYSTSFSTERREREKENEQVVREIVEIAPIHFETTR